MAGGPGNDRLSGGPGDDTAVYAGPRKRYMVTPVAGKPGVTQVADMLSGAGSDGTDALEGVEFLQFSDGTVPVDNPGPNNAGPTPKAIGFTVVPGGSAALALQAVDPEGDAITYAIGSQPALGAATVSNAGGLTYVAGQNAGTDTFVVKATDPFGATGDVTVTVTIVSAPAGTDGPDLLFGGPGADTIAGQGGDDSVSGDLGNDSLKGGGGGDSLSGGPGNDSLDGGTGDDIMNGGPGDDSFVVDSAGDVVIEKLNEGRDSVSASVTFALPDNVEALALAGNAPIGGTGNALANTLTGNGGANTLAGGGGNDRLDGGPGKDKLDGGDGFDTAAYAGSKAAVSVNLAKKTATGGDAAGDTLVSIENLVGSPFADTLVGTAGANVIEGGGGADRLTGGKGADRYVYRAAGHSTPRKSDTILGFKASEGDRIDLSAIDAVPGTAKNDAFAWIGSKRFSRKKGQLRFAGGALQADLNGDGKADLRIVLDRVTSLPRSATIR